PDWHRGHDPAQDVRAHCGDHRRIRVAGRDRVDRDTQGGGLQGERLREADDAGLGGGVIRLAALARKSVDRADIHDSSEPSLTHPFDDRSAHVETAAEIDVEYRAPLLV